MNPAVRIVPRAEIIARRARLGFAGAGKARMQPPPKPTLAATPPATMDGPPQWQRADTHFNDHVIRWQAHMCKAALNPAKSYLATRAVELGFTPEQMVAQDRRRPTALARQIIIYELKASVKPDMSFPDIGRLMGGRDQGTIFHAFKKIGDEGLDAALARLRAMRRRA